MMFAQGSAGQWRVLFDDCYMYLDYVLTENRCACRFAVPASLSFLSSEQQSVLARCAVATEVGGLPQLVDVERERRERKYRKKIARQARRDATAAQEGGGGE